MDRVIVSIVSVLFIATWSAVIMLFMQTEDAPIQAKKHQEVDYLVVQNKESSSFYVLTERNTSENVNSVNSLTKMVNKRESQGVSIDDLLDYFDLDEEIETAPNS